MRFSRRQFILSAAAGFAVAPRASFAAGKLNVVATTGMIADTVRRIGGDMVEVRGLMGPGVDPHAYRQTRSDIVAMTRADIVFWHGLYLEAQMEDFFHKLEKRGSVVSVTDKLPRDLLRGHDDYNDKYDPHVWMDPKIWVLVAERVRDALIEARPEQRAVFEANASAFADELRVLADYANRTLATVNAESRVLLTAHDAFGYFGTAYDFEVMGIQGISTESEAGLNRISALVDMLVERKIGAVFVESSVSDRSMRAVIEGAAAKGHDVKIGGELFSDAMGTEGTYEGTYVGMIDHNVTVIASALGGEAPDRGLNGKLSAGS
ncbi:manganese/zinc/iron transport system substrate-binding protein [Shimia isoporae]|uniref:Manganese/zinc/iron transport system substrate-binding protein n=1 Tax=Shimia isoporae TaxID=647720 RepID=A0A4R1N403_9RHOB|nr:zinc ABC transporter substrate-binding protein [Shimia isoporae]TCL01275.1 manganese/zinc/iron transport system substrate-binding protein [Shimia isoporae]